MILLPFNTTTTSSRIVAPALLYMVSSKEQEEDKKQQRKQVIIDEGRNTTTMMMKTTVTVTNTSNKNNNNKLKSIMPKSKKSVRFQFTVSIREYPIILGDNPSCCCLLLKTGGGPPLSIDWTYVESTQAIISQRNSNSKEGKPRKRCGMERYDLLLRQGYSSLEIKRAIKVIKIEQRRRNLSRQKFIIKELMNQHLLQMQDSIRRNLNLLQQAKQQVKQQQSSLTTRSQQPFFIQTTTSP